MAVDMKLMDLRIVKADLQKYKKWKTLKED